MGAYRAVVKLFLLMAISFTGCSINLHGFQLREDVQDELRKAAKSLAEAGVSAMPRPDPGSVNGVVRDELGNPIVGAIVSIGRQDVKTGPNGTYEVGGLKKGKYMKVVSAREYTPLIAEVEIKPDIDSPKRAVGACWFHANRVCGGSCVVCSRGQAGSGSQRQCPWHGTRQPDG